MDCGEQWGTSRKAYMGIAEHEQQQKKMKEEGEAAGIGWDSFIYTFCVSTNFWILFEMAIFIFVG